MTTRRSQPSGVSMDLCSELTSRPVGDILGSERVLAVLDFTGPARARTQTGDPRHVATGLPSLFPGSAREVWRSSTPVNVGWTDAVGWAAGEFGLFATRTIQAPLGRDVADVARQAWSDLLETAEAKGCPHLVRAWNHLPHINAGDGDEERYKRFCVGRHQAFMTHGYMEDRFPAATAVGNFGDELVVYLLACPEPGRHFENPRQVRAPSYPRRYGPQPPSFARATHRADAKLAFVAGTASIVGHRTVHPGDLAGQLAVTFENIDRLLRTMPARNGAGHGLDCVRVYLREPQHLALAREAVENRMPLSSAVYVHGEICRSQLEVEIEGVRHE